MFENSVCPETVLTVQIWLSPLELFTRIGYNKYIILHNSFVKYTNFLTHMKPMIKIKSSIWIIIYTITKHCYTFHSAAVYIGVQY